jgi:hypothetical protein
MNTHTRLANLNEKYKEEHHKVGYTLISLIVLYLTKTPFVCWKVVSFWKVNYFPMFGSVMKNKLENIFQCLVMSWKMSWKITY